jgi:hypothetical protein
VKVIRQLDGTRVLAEFCGAVITIAHVEPPIHAIERLEKLSCDFEQSDGNSQKDSSPAMAFERPCFPVPVDVDGGDMTSISNFLMRELTCDRQCVLIKLQCAFLYGSSSVTNILRSSVSNRECSAPSKSNLNCGGTEWLRQTVAVSRR